MKKILIIKFGALGDLSYALPAAKALKSSFDCHITWLVGNSCASFLKDHSSIDDVISIDDKKIYGKNFFAKLFELAKTYLKLKKRFDNIIILHRDKIYYRAFRLLSRGVIFQLSREKNNSKNFVHVAPMTLHESRAIKKLIARFVLFISQKKEIPWQWDYSHISTTHIHLPENFGVIHLGGGSNSKTEFRLKCWPHWEEFILKILRNTALNLVFVGAPSEEHEFKKMNLDSFSNCINLIGKTTIPELVDVIRRSDFLVGVDSGPLHIADSLNKKTIGLFGPTSSVSWGLLSQHAHIFKHDVPCSPCYKDDGIFPACGFGHQCMNGIDAEKVFQTAITTLSPSL
jgi:ADP-heptose:LPS heptosyltransferase